MAERCPGAEPVGAAALRDHRFEIGERGVATVGAFPDSTTWGVLWWISAAHEEALDRREGVHVGLYRREVLGVAAPWGTSASLVYVEPFNGSGAPRGGYMESILRGAKAFGLPDEYVADLASRYA